MQDTGYQAFQRRLMPTVPAEKVIGVRTPALRALARELAGSPEAEAFLGALPHAYYEEDNLHGFLLERVGDFDAAWPWVAGPRLCPWVRAKAIQKALESRRITPEQKQALRALRAGLPRNP